MAPRLLKAITGVTLVAGGMAGLLLPIGRLPPLGPLLDPAGGVWATAGAAEFRDRTIAFRGLEAPVEAVVDRRGVPHIFAETELDAYRALGYLVARDRLFQLELQTRAAAGTLGELIGAAALPLDRNARALGFGRMAERGLAGLDSADLLVRSIRAYGEGVNAWIDGLRPADLPLEFRLLGKRPTRWSDARSVLLFAQMALTLASNDVSLDKVRVARRVGWAAADALFPVNSPIQEPIQPVGDSLRRMVAAPIAPPGPPDTTALAIGSRAGPRDDDRSGSNNWAVMPRRTAANRTLLAGDPHLQLTLPSIWYQAHLVVPGQFDVQGVTLPGAPWVVIGFNRHIAWSMTNTGADVNDFYRETVDDRDRPTRYRVDGEWRPIELRSETIRGPRGETLAVDTVRFTHRGPMRQVGGEWVSMAWVIYGDRVVAAEFLAVARAKTAAEFLEATRGYVAPAQNMLVADRRGTIAIRSTGHYPIRPADGRGDVVRDGSLSANDWQGMVAAEYYPFSLNPERGYLTSANQQPVHPGVNGRYLGADWPSPWRAIRINRLLAADSQVTPESMGRFQTDPISERGLAFREVLLGRGSDSARLAGAGPEVKAARALLAEWGGSYARDDRRAVLFEAIMAELNRRTWDELAPRDSASEDADPPARPSEAVLYALTADAASQWWDQVATTQVERRDDIIEASLAAALDSVTRRHGPPSGDGWRWGATHQANINHLLRLPALSATGLEVDGGPSTLSPSSGSGTHGASWRMVVELGPMVRAWGVYPGGQSGNPVSKHYRDLLPAWQRGALDTLAFPAEATEVASPDHRWVFRPGRAR
ncbi:MAG: penicillin acylase family protein [Gemmatimonadetes bacterium]|nr:penicillin acylase family protein [Gemmatimonadota bacterium]